MKKPTALTVVAIILIDFAATPAHADWRGGYRYGYGWGPRIDLGPPVSDPLSPVFHAPPGFR